MQESYDKEVYDEFVLPTVITENGKPVSLVKPNDSVIFFNFRPDRAREITRAFCCDDFDGFERAKAACHSHMYVSRTTTSQYLTSL